MNTALMVRRSPQTLAEDALNAVGRARLDLVLDHPFYGALALRLRPVIDPTCEFVWTDGMRMGINPEAFLSLDHHQRKTLIAHEVLHCTNGHPWRQAERDPEAWSEACDLAINHILQDCGFQLPEAMKLPSQSQQGKAAEVIYQELQKQPKGNNPDPDGKGEGSGESDGDGEVEDGKGQGFCDMGAMRHPDAATNGQGKSPSRNTDIEKLENNWKIAAIQAALAAKCRGELPGDLAQLIEEIKNPKIDWRAELRRFMQTHAKNDYSWSRPNTRYLASRLYMPALHSEQMGPIAIAIDTSGSIGDEELKQFLGETGSIVDELKPEYTLVIEADAAVNGVNRYDSGEIFSLPEIHGRGGTDFRPAFDYLNAEGIEPACLIYLTDLYGPEPDEPPPYPVLWVCTTDQEASFGQTIRLDVNEIS